MEGSSGVVIRRCRLTRPRPSEIAGGNFLVAYDNTTWSCSGRHSNSSPCCSFHCSHHRCARWLCLEPLFKTPFPFLPRQYTPPSHLITFPIHRTHAAQSAPTRCIHLPRSPRSQRPRIGSDLRPALPGGGYVFRCFSRCWHPCLLTVDIESFNTLGQDPCTVLAYLSDAGNMCACNNIAYNPLSVCAPCQGGTWISCAGPFSLLH